MYTCVCVTGHMASAYIKLNSCIYEMNVYVLMYMCAFGHRIAYRYTHGIHGVCEIGLLHI